MRKNSNNNLNKEWKFECEFGGGIEIFRKDGTEHFIKG